MQRSRLGALALGTSALLGAALASPALAATDSEIPTFSEFHASAYQDADKQYIVNGDEPVATTSSATPWASATSTPAPRPAPASRTTTGAR